MPLFPGRQIRKPVSLHLEVHPDKRNKLFSQLLPCAICFRHKGGHATWGWEKTDARKVMKKTKLWSWSKKLWDYKYICLKKYFQIKSEELILFKSKCNSPTFHSLVHCRDNSSLNILQNFSFLCFTEEKKSYWLGKTWRWVNDDR